MNSSNLIIGEADGVRYIKFPKFEAVKTVRHIFSTRLGGVSTGRYKSMNLSLTNGDERENVIENYNRLCKAAGIDINNLVLSRQTHTDNIKSVTEKDRGTGIFKNSFNDVDGLITDRKGVALVTQYADCTPLLFCDPVKGVIASSHAGWRGTAKLIGEKTVKKMINDYGCSPENIIAAIGPCIGKCCYEVDGPVAEAFSAIPFLSLEAVLSPKGDGKYMLDLVEANKQILVHAGLSPDNIDLSDICTCCNSDELHSHRATHGERGNLAMIIEMI